MRISIAILGCLFAGPAFAYCSKPLSISSPEDHTSYLACVIEEQGKAIEKLNDRIEALSSSISTLDDTIDDLQRKL